MKTKFIPFFHSLAFAGATLFLLVVAPCRAHARFVFTLTQTNGNVVINGTGTLNTTALVAHPGGSDSPNFAPIYASLTAGPTGNSNVTAYGGGGLTGPTSFGTGDMNIIPSSGTGGFAGIFGRDTPFLETPSGYTSGTLLTNSSTYIGQSFASFGFTPGTYTYTWGTGANADSLTVTSVVPEPSTWVAGSMCCILLLGVAFRRRPA